MSSTPTDRDCETNFVDQLRVAITRLARSQRAIGARTHMEPFSLMSTLSTIERAGPRTPTELAELEGVSKPSMTRALAKLEDRGYVTRSAHPSDSRQQMIAVTESGTKAIRDTRQSVNEWYMEHISQLSADERAALRGGVAALLRLADEAL